MSYAPVGSSVHANDDVRRAHRKTLLVTVGILAIIAGIGYIPSWVITSVTSWIGNLKFEEVWGDVAPTTWTATGIIIAVLAVIAVAYFYLTVIAPLIAIRHDEVQPDGRTDSVKWAER